jgi:hypothetical protein
MRARSYVRVVNLSPLSRVALFKIRPAVAMEKKKERLTLNEEEKKLVFDSHSRAGQTQEYVEVQVTRDMLAYATKLDETGQSLRADKIRRWCNPVANKNQICNIVNQYLQKHPDMQRATQPGPKIGSRKRKHPDMQRATQPGPKIGSRKRKKQPQKQPQKAAASAAASAAAPAAASAAAPAAASAAAPAAASAAAPAAASAAEKQKMWGGWLDLTKDVLKRWGDGNSSGGSSGGAKLSAAPQRPPTQEVENPADEELEDLDPEQQLAATAFVASDSEELDNDQRLADPSSDSEKLDNDQRLAARAFLETDDADMLAASAYEHSITCCCPERWPIR